MSTSIKYDLDLTDYGTTGWNQLLKNAVEGFDLHLHTRILVTLGETVIIGESLYLKSDGKYWKGKAVAGMLPCAGVALEAGNADDTIVIQRIGPCTVSTWTFTGDPGDKVFLDPTTAGALIETRPAEFAQLIGYVISATQLFLWVNEPSPIHYGVGAAPSPANYTDGIVYFQLETSTTTTTTT
jgi:hypothetical protein